MIQISKVLGNASAKAINVRTFDDLIKYATSTTYSLATFKKNHRTIENFEQTELIGLDIDDGMSIDEAKEAFKDYKHLILPTRSHRIEKNGVVADRFRVILTLSQPITDAETYYATWHSLAQKFPAIDPAAKDPSRQFYKSTSVYSRRDDGATVDPVVPTAKPKLEVVKTVSLGERGELSKRTLKFLLEGAAAGKRHGELYFAVRDMHEQGYSQDECIEKVSEMITRTGNWGDSTLNKKDLETIADGYSRDPRHAPRVSDEVPSPFKFQNVADLVNTSDKVEWIVKDLLAEGGVSILAGTPKAGKSILARGIAKSIAQGKPFLGFEAKQGSVVYLAVEEHRSEIRAQVKSLGIQETDPILFHVGSVMGGRRWEDLHAFLEEHKPAFCVIDTVFKFHPVKSVNDYAEIGDLMGKIAHVARTTNTHIMLIHHANKPSQTGGSGTSSILGSTALFGGVDVAMILKRDKNTNTLLVEPRSVSGFRCANREVKFDKDTLTFSMGVEKDDF